MHSPTVGTDAAGSILLGIMINISLLGVITAQVLTYFRRSRAESRSWIHSFVASLFLANGLNCILPSVFLYEVLIARHGDPAALQKGTWTWNSEPALTAIIAGCVQLFYAWRIQVLTKYRSITILVVLCALVAISSGVITSISSGRHPYFSDWPSKYHIEFGMWLGASLLADIVITGTLFSFLYKRRTGDIVMDNMINRISIMTLQTGLLTSIVALADMFAVHSNAEGIHLILNTPLSKLYTSSFMSMLNTRAGLEGSKQHDVCSTDSQDKNEFTTVGSLELHTIPEEGGSAIDPQSSSALSKSCNEIEGG
ncbi:hypothetical protein FIBSPDRAFT_849242 [Athelia psychrophila]|uniref:DUF6534 domain-containing protein n=1 Tax=Athelia psychrophila TaxID=1759441 RepID=A0A166UJ81_9AGAM|nr:hypothetical protein FIBSPDRAFT_849242 [Fibularhizoctonia sp. CBS 109695]